MYLLSLYFNRLDLGNVELVTKVLFIASGVSSPANSVLFFTFILFYLGGYMKVEPGYLLPCYARTV
jgi:hypothetical protein